MWLFYLLLLVGFEAIADIFAKEYQLKSGWTRFGISILFYIIANIFWLVALKNGAGLTKGAILFSVSSAILAIIIGLVLYREQLTGMQMVGITLGLVAFTLMVWE